jgi:hypothetical protein
MRKLCLSRRSRADHLPRSHIGDCQFLAGIPAFCTICVTRDLIADTVAGNPFLDQRATFHFPCHPTPRYSDGERLVGMPLGMRHREADGDPRSLMWDFQL